MSKEELEVQKEAEKLAKKNKKDDTKKDTDAKKDKKDDVKKDSAATVAPIEIELDDLDNRVARLTINSSNLSDAVLTPDGDKLYYLSRFEKGFDLWVNELKENNTRRSSSSSKAKARWT